MTGRGRASDRPWIAGHPDGPRIDVEGVAWFACDPYPLWYRWEGERLIKGTPTFPEGDGRADQ